ncbi:hypothetical protein [Vibrio phage vB_VmeM-Yong XC32]|nr:hypothetical protein [Vibrio phage vB_VmeM-Yong XC31]QAX96381.1 hypothetical protein [Vibrio phage vB_VmeM-Yong XC32]QAX96699.1 hypothetical protein [Vibrio phage vB_VmeM-Yong MS31]QAX97017.1 hypothetical protein [Vibrio phage vB_VmeM-Yong MS32]
MARMSTEKFVEKFRARHPDSTIMLDKFEYLGDKVASTVYCGVEGCGYEWEIRPSNLMQGRGCKECKYRNQNESRKITEKQFITETKKRDPNIDLSKFEYKGLKEHGWAVCKTCKHEWWVQAESVMRKTGCPECGYKKMAEKRFYQDGKYDDLKARLKEDGIEHSSLDGKKNTDTIHCKCKACGREWDPIISNLVHHGTGCQTCGNANRGLHLEITESALKFRLTQSTAITGHTYSFVKDKGTVKLTCSCHGENTYSGRDLYLRVIPECCKAEGIAVVYLMPIDGAGAFKLGFTSSLKSRMGHLGLNKAYVWSTKDPSEEKLVLDSMPYPTLSKESFGVGYTETRIMPEGTTLEEHVKYVSSILQREPVAVIKR